VSRGLLISVSGIDSSGKSTQLSRLLEAAQARGERPVRLWSRPGYTPTLEAAKASLKRFRSSGAAATNTEGAKPRTYPRRAASFRSGLRKRAWLSLALLDLIWWYGVRLRAWRAAGRTVICDRYLPDCWVDFRVNFPDDDVESWLLARALAAVAPRPDAAFLLHIPVEESLQRSLGRDRRFRESAAVLGRRLAVYEALAGESGVAPLDGRRPAEALAREIDARVDAVRRSAKSSA